MTYFSRLVFSGFGAAAITIGLGLTMVKMIHVEFEAQRDKDRPEFILDPMMDDIVIIDRLTAIAPLKKIVPPPAPPPTGYNAAGQPKIPQPQTPESPTGFKLPDPGYDITNTIGADVDAVPILRIAPQMPREADRSGHCNMIFDVSPDGSPFNIQASSCTQNLFRNSSIKATEKFKYRPKRIDGQTVTMRGVKTTIRFKLLDDRGRLIAES